MMASVISWALMALIAVGKIHLQWAGMQGQCMQRNDKKTLWEEGELAGKIESVGPGWYRFVEAAYEEEGERVLEAAPLAAGASVAESAVCKEKRPWVFADRQRFLEVDQSSVDRV